MEIKDEELVKKIARRFSETFHVGLCGEPTMPTENKIVLTFGFIGDEMSDYKIYLAIYDNGFTVNVRYENEARKKFHENYVSQAYYSDIKSSEDFCKKIAAAIFVEIHTFCDDDIIPPTNFFRNTCVYYTVLPPGLARGFTDFFVEND